MNSGCLDESSGFSKDPLKQRVHQFMKIEHTLTLTAKSNLSLFMCVCLRERQREGMDSMRERIRVCEILNSQSCAGGLSVCAGAKRGKNGGRKGIEMEDF